MAIFSTWRAALKEHSVQIAQDLSRIVSRESKTAIHNVTIMLSTAVAFALLLCSVWLTLLSMFAYYAYQQHFSFYQISMCIVAFHLILMILLFFIIRCYAKKSFFPQTEQALSILIK